LKQAGIKDKEHGMKKVFVIGLIALVGAAVYFGVVTLRTGDGELSIGFDGEKAAAVASDVKSVASDALEKVKSHEEL
jgi:hypothetical protein